MIVLSLFEAVKMKISQYLMTVKCGCFWTQTFLRFFPMYFELASLLERTSRQLALFKEEFVFVDLDKGCKTYNEPIFGEFELLLMQTFHRIFLQGIKYILDFIDVPKAHFVFHS